MKGALGGLVDSSAVGDAVKEGIKAAASDASDRIGKTFDDSVARHQELRKLLASFSTKLEELAALLSSITLAPTGLSAGPEPSEYPLLIFVDELDRCRPDYAIKLLEQMKHLFSVPGVIFVLAINGEQLNHSIRAVYGAGFDSARYLRRFIDFDIRLPRGDVAAMTAQRAQTLAAQLSVSVDRSVLEWLGRCARAFGLAARDAEQVSAKLIVALKIRDGRALLPDLLCLLVVAMHRDPTQLEDFTPSLTWATRFFKRVVELPWTADYDTAHSLCIVGIQCLYTRGVKPDEMAGRLDFCRNDLSTMTGDGTDVVPGLIDYVDYIKQQRIGRGPLETCVNLARSLL